MERTVNVRRTRRPNHRATTGPSPPSSPSPPPSGGSRGTTTRPPPTTTDVAQTQACVTVGAGSDVQNSVVGFLETGPLGGVEPTSARFFYFVCVFGRLPTSGLPVSRRDGPLWVRRRTGTEDLSSGIKDPKTLCVPPTVV